MRERTGATLAILLGAGIGIGLMVPPWSAAEEEGSAHRVPNRSVQEGKEKAGRPAAKAKDPLERKVDEILANQAAILANQARILQRFDAVMEELRIVKVRATLRGS